MKTVSRTLVYIALLSCTLVAPDASRAAPSADQATEANITRLTASILARSQFSHHPLDKELSAKFLDRYLDAIGDAVLASVGCYQLAGIGVQLFELLLASVKLGSNWWRRLPQSPHCQGKNGQNP